MNGQYSKMKSSTHKSRSMDFSDVIQFSSKDENPRKSRMAAESPKIAELSDGSACYDSCSGGESFRAVLSRSGSTASKRFGVGLEAQSVGAQCSGIRRALSMRRSSSVSERYCRIHDQSLTEMDFEEEDDARDMAGPVKKMKRNRGRRIFGACRRFFGL
ncbi:hypothetical protein SAY87_017801 [Trapa incisa]|uniref:Uncharacterized protein n=1 Tax=Trapa incisa TaxID=236973 RepID=A0AAN7L500_9MYRT|nr:hypothetical protein SAY87_017801 [Trapa incisa]